ncbi:MAG: hypothetical protein ABW136_12400 [Steroidobacteraceae bacterium]
MNAIPNIAEHVELEIRIEARFVLWALRCCAHRRDVPLQTIAQEVARGFELADAAETLDRFWRFAQALCDVVETPGVWHHPTCDCVSSEEMQVLEALSHAALERPETVRIGTPWRRLVGDDYALLVDRLARQWLHALRNAGICYPAPGQLVREGSAGTYAGLPVPPQRH